MKRERILSIQVARGVAALLVVLYHASRMVALPQYAGEQGFDGFFAFGHSGIDFFFVLSGFIIYFVHHADLGHPQALPHYAWRRVTRIYPSYWLITAAMVVLLVAKHDPSLTTRHILHSIFLIADTHLPLLEVGWTLVFEMMFYAVFALGILNFRLGVAAIVLWGMLIVAGIGTGSEYPMLRTAGSYRGMEFVIGIFAAMIVLNTHVRGPLLILWTGIAGFLAIGLAENVGLLTWNAAPTNLLFATMAGVMIVGMAAAEQKGALKVDKVSEFFGGMSYLLYLVHPLIVGQTFRALQFAGVVHAIPGWASVLLASACAILVAGLLYRYFEQPVLAALNRFGQHRLFAKRQPA
ncbi:MAG TPA: acyltransferase [Rhizomicrobium sp.]|nr:acyltransferase [Rhizomicrobium sp.]